MIQHLQRKQTSMQTRQGKARQGKTGQDSPVNKFPLPAATLPAVVLHVHMYPVEITFAYDDAVGPFFPAADEGRDLPLALRFRLTSFESGAGFGTFFSPKRLALSAFHDASLAAGRHQQKRVGWSI
ncbi:hypothetical protein FSARC_9917 [Fusarium sarcochroum]|uniref:Uncharacterized protein n=1 Tax=Fusarium sarcochroum TaxID=1208366 RepID=A0A8H4X5B4_9HYPO|nr:hypothetical protein FSARC_9917 [Fusarium sarcochroum]